MVKSPKFLRDLNSLVNLDEFEDLKDVEVTEEQKIRKINKNLSLTFVPSLNYISTKNTMES